MAGKGRLTLRVDESSVWLSNNLPYVVRDAASAFVAGGRVGERPSVELPEGYYTVEVITPSGAPQTQVVQVRAEQDEPVVIGDPGSVPPEPAAAPPPATAAGAPAPMPMSPPPPPPTGAAPGLRSGWWHRRRRGEPAAAPARPSTPAPGTPAPVAATPSRSPLLDTHLCTARRDRDGWTFTPPATLDGVPTARLQLDDDPPWVVSLALNPLTPEDPLLRECRVRIAHVTGEPARPVASFSPQRRVSRLLEGVLRHHQVPAAGLVDQAAELLLSKYQDPPAAVLGGLTLHRFGRLHGRQRWVENLARDFPWLPDGQILCAALLMHDEDPAERSRGLDLLLGATEARPLYTDGLSLATDLLRRWPGTERDEERTEALELLAGFACTADWDAVMLTNQEVW